MVGVAYYIILLPYDYSDFNSTMIYRLSKNISQGYSYSDLT